METTSTAANKDKLMLGHNIIVIGASAGGVEAITKLVSELPPDLSAAIFVVLHVPSQSPSVLPSILNRGIKKRHPNSPLIAVHPRNGEAIELGRIYVAPPDHHLLLKDGYITLARGPKENGHRPSVDPLFRTAARQYGGRVVGVVLSGVLDDGTAGLTAVKQQGGVAIVQDPDEALYAGMPRSAIENVEVDYILPVAEIVPVLVDLAHQPVAQAAKPVSKAMEIETDMAELEPGAMQKLDRPGKPSPFACPDCNGVLWEIDDGQVSRFRCRTGHAYSAGTLLAKQSEALEEALWNALRALEEKAALTQKMAIRAGDRNQPISAKRFEEQARFSQERALLIREMLLQEGNGQSTTNGQVVGKGITTVVNDRQVTTNNLELEETLPLQVVGIYTSTEDQNALIRVLSALPGDLPAAIIIIEHLYPHQPNLMADILSRSTALAVQQAKQGDLLCPGTVYIAPPDCHILISGASISLSYSQLVHFACPSADLLFESIAASFKQGAIAVVLNGTGNDGAMGVRAIKEMGGTVIAQQATYESFSLPKAAIETTDVDAVVPLNEIAPTLVSQVTTRLNS